MNRRRSESGRWSGPDGEHGLSGLPEYRVWVAMIQRCHRPNDKGYRNYGARGITVCLQWRQSFVTFLADMGQRPTAGHTIERNDNAGGYEPGNCRWATRGEQGNNQRTNRLLEMDGKTQTLSQWAREFGLYSQVVGCRLKNGMGLREALSKPLALRRGGRHNAVQSPHEAMAPRADR